MLTTGFVFGLNLKMSEQYTHLVEEVYAIIIMINICVTMTTTDLLYLLNNIDNDVSTLFAQSHIIITLRITNHIMTNSKSASYIDLTVA